LEFARLEESVEQPFQENNNLQALVPEVEQLGEVVPYVEQLGEVMPYVEQLGEVVPYVEPGVEAGRWKKRQKEQLARQEVVPIDEKLPKRGSESNAKVHTKLEKRKRDIIGSVYKHDFNHRVLPSENEAIMLRVNQL
jgi:hypothetical protein